MEFTRPFDVRKPILLLLSSSISGSSSTPYVRLPDISRVINLSLVDDSGSIDTPSAAVVMALPMLRGWSSGVEMSKWGKAVD